MGLFSHLAFLIERVQPRERQISTTFAIKEFYRTISLKKGWLKFTLNIKKTYHWNQHKQHGRRVRSSTLLKTRNCVKFSALKSLYKNKFNFEILTKVIFWRKSLSIEVLLAYWMDVLKWMEEKYPVYFKLFWVVVKCLIWGVYAWENKQIFHTEREGKLQKWSHSSSTRTLNII